MRILPLAALAVGLSCASAAYAQSDYGHGRDRDRASQDQQDERYDRRRGDDRQYQRSRSDENRARRDRRSMERMERRSSDWNRIRVRDSDRRWNGQTQYSRDRDRWRDRSGTWRDRDRRFTRDGDRSRYTQYRRNTWSHRRFNVGYYNWPRGYRYHRYSFGQFLPFIFITSAFIIDDWYDYGLYDPPYDLVWVRYGPDALLIDRETGEIVAVRYNVFY